MRTTLRIFVVALALSALSPAGALADEPRPVPDYDGRPDEPPTAGEVLIWIPRVILLPGYLVTEYVVRRPLSAFVTWLESEKIVQQAYGLLTFGSDGAFGIFPTALFDFGLRPSVGLYAFIDPFLHPDNRFRVSAAYGGPDWLSVGAKDRVILADDDGGELVLRGGYLRRPDYPFYGIGAEARQTDETFFRLSRAEIVLSLALRQDHFGFSADARWGSDRREGSDYDKSTPQFFGDDFLDAAGVADFRYGQFVEQRLDLWADTRPLQGAWAASGTGARLDLRGGLGFDPENAALQRWVRYGGVASLFLDLTGTRRVLGLNVSADAVDPLGDEPLPMGALTSLGGIETMRGFYQGRFVGRSAATATLEYRWPIASFLDAELFASLGNAFGERFEDFELDRLAGSGGFAIRTNTSRDLSFDILIAAGTRQFYRGDFAVENIRFAIGTNRGF